MVKIEQRRQLQHLVCAGGNVLGDIFNPAFQNTAEIVEGGGGQGSVLSKLVNGGTGNVVSVDERVGRLGGAGEGLPEGCVVYQCIHLPVLMLIKG